MSRTMSAIDMDPWPPWPIASCGELTGDPASVIGSQMWWGTDWPAQWYPQSRTQSRRSVMLVRSGS
jgi:hypothetical protein